MEPSRQGKAPVYKPEVMSRRLPEESESSELHKAARLYLSLDDNQLQPDLLTDIGDQLLGSSQPEYRFYGAWACLEAAYPGLFGLDAPSKVTQSVDVESVSDRAFRTFDQLARRAPHHTGTGASTRTAPLADLYFGIKAQLALNIRPVFRPARITRHTGPAAVAQEYAHTAYLLREQDIALAHSRRDDRYSPETGELLNYKSGLIRGFETENKLLGLGWTHASNDPESPVLLLPSSPRHDYGMARNNTTPFDVVAIHRQAGVQLGIPLKRDVYVSRGINGDRAGVTDKIVHMYGDRDLELENLLSLATYNPQKFEAFDPALARRIIYHINHQFERIQQEVAQTPKPKHPVQTPAA